MLNLTDKFVVSEEVILNEGIVPTGAIIEIVEFDYSENKYAVLIKPYLKNKIRTEYYTNLEEIYIKKISSLIHPKILS